MSPAGRGNRILGTVLITPFVLGGLAAVIVGITFIGGEGKDLDFGYVLVASGGIMMLIFGAALVSYRRSLHIARPAPDDRGVRPAQAFVRLERPRRFSVCPWR